MSSARSRLSGGVADDMPSARRPADADADVWTRDNLVPATVEVFSTFLF
jgi:hypothetical protein